MTLQVDTIAALATATGVGAVAVLRVSGPQAFEIVDRVTQGAQSLPRMATLRDLHHPQTNERVDQVLVTRFPGPASYTGEDVVEISGHGGALAPALVLDALVAAGARLAEAGEFTRRAWLNGKLDLVQAEAISDLIEGRSRMAHRTALHQLDRGLSARVDALRERLIGVEALLAHHIDFPEEDDAPTPLPAIVLRARELIADLNRLAGTASEGVLLRRGALVVLAGPPNAGKSSLLNALAGEERALVTAIPGTTRDAIEVEVSLGGFPFRLVDTAGLRETEEQIERMGIEVAERYLGAADLVLLCLAADGQAPGRGDVVEVLAGRTSAPILRVNTKMDLADGFVEGGPLHEGGSPDLQVEADESGGGSPVEMDAEAGPRSGDARVAGELSISALSGQGLPGLRALLPSLVFRGLVSASEDVPVLTRERQAEAVRRAATEVRGFIGAIEDGVPAEIASAHLKSAETALEELLGVVTEDDVLDVVFRSFCVGK